MAYDDMNMKELFSKLVISTTVQLSVEEAAKRFDEMLRLCGKHTKAQLYMVISLNSFMEMHMITETDYRTTMNSIQDLVIESSRKQNQGGDKNES